MTWGELRFQLQTGASGVSLDLIDGWLNTRYEQVLEATDWTGLKAHTIIQTRAAYISGADTAAATVGSATITGDGTSWTSALVGLRFYLAGDTALYTVLSVAGQALVLDRPYEGTGSDAAGTVYQNRAYVFMQNIYPLPADFRTIEAVLNPITWGRLSEFSPASLDSMGPRTHVADPFAYALYDDTAEDAPPVVHQIELYPPPVLARGFPVEYIRTAIGFDGSNTSSSPLPWVSATVLLEGVRADVANYLEKPAQVTFHEGKFQEELRRMLLLQHAQRRPKTAMQMATRFTRHRTQRWSR